MNNTTDNLVGLIPENMISIYGFAKARYEFTKANFEFTLHGNKR